MVTRAPNVSEPLYKIRTYELTESLFAIDVPPLLAVLIQVDPIPLVQLPRVKTTEIVVSTSVGLPFSMVGE
jgi:hypothetical protein